MAKATIMPDKKGSDLVREDCGKCDVNPQTGKPSGYIRAFGHVLGGVCFDCNGSGGRTVKVSSIRARETNRKRAAAKRKAQFDEADAARKVWEAANAALLEQMKASADEWVLDFTRTVAVPTEGQVAAIVKALEAEAAEAARKAAADPVPVTTARIAFTGTVLGFKEVEDTYGWTTRYVTKMIFQDDRGFKVYGTAPAGVSKGDQIEFTATVERSRDDALFGFFKRPTKVKVLEAAAA